MKDPINPTHYKRYPFEVIALTKDMSFVYGNILKYLLRAPFKGTLKQDLEKAAWYAAYVQMDSRYQTDKIMMITYLYGVMPSPRFGRAELTRVEETIASNVEDHEISDAMSAAFHLYYQSTVATNVTAAAAAMRKFVEAIVKLPRIFKQEEETEE